MVIDGDQDSEMNKLKKIENASKPLVSYEISDEEEIETNVV